MDRDEALKFYRRRIQERVQERRQAEEKDIRFNLTDKQLGMLIESRVLSLNEQEADKSILRLEEELKGWKVINLRAIREDFGYKNEDFHLAIGTPLVRHGKLKDIVAACGGNGNPIYVARKEDTEQRLYEYIEHDLGLSRAA